MGRGARFLVLLAFGAVWSGAPARCAAELMVFAAVSLTEALQEHTAAYEAATGTKVVFNFGASSLLARQIQEGAPADVFFSADEAKMDELGKKGLLVPGTRLTLLSNTLVVVIESGSAVKLESPRDLAAPVVRHIAIAEPSSVPAGIYAKQYLKSAGVWRAVIDKLVPVENVRAALAAVEAGNCEAGIVYRTDARVSKRVQVAFEVPPALGPRISYPVAVVASSAQQEAAQRFVAFLRSDAARESFTARGFLVLEVRKQ